MKNITQAGRDALDANHIEMALAFEMEVDDIQTIRVHSRVGDMTVDGDVYQGIGTLGKVTPVSVNGSAKPNGIQLELSGVDAAMITVALGNNYQGRPAQLTLVILDQDDYTIIDTHSVFKGRVDTMELKTGVEGKITVKIENKLVDWMRTDKSLWTQADHDRTLPTGESDQFFAFINEVINKQIEFTPYQHWKNR